MVAVAQAGGRLLRRLRGELASALLRTFLARGIAAAGSFVLVLILGRLYGAAGVGVFAIAQGVIVGASLLARHGMDGALMRFVGRNPQSLDIMTYLRWACTKASVLSVMAAVLVYAGRGLLERIFGAEGLSLMLVGIAAAIPAFTMATTLSGFMKGIRKPATACTLQNGSVALIAGLLVIALDSLRPQAGIANIGLAYAIAAWLVLVQGLWHIWCWRKKQVLQSEAIHPVAGKDEFAASSGAFFVLNLAVFMRTVLAIMIAGYFLSSTELGLFKAALQLAVFVGFIHIVINAVFPPRFAELFHQGKTQALERLARQGAKVGVALTAPFLIMCILAPELLLGMLGSEFIQAANLLRIIAVAHLVNAATGSIGYLLNMTGHERLLRNIALICNSVGLALFFIMIPLFGAIGAACVTAFVIVAQSLVATVYSWRRLGIWAVPAPNLLKFMGIQTDKEAIC